MLRDMVIGATKNMIQLYETSRTISHEGEKGMFREFFIAQLIRPLLPQQYGIGTGIIIDAYGNQSKQSDIIIYDRRLLPPIFASESRGIFPIDSVLIVLEVKSKIAASDYGDLVEAASLFNPKNPKSLRIATKGKLDGTR
jgi:hypothetical protein